MPSWMRRRLTYANVIATLALFLALNVGAYAAIRIPANSIGSAQLKNKAVTPKKVSPAAVKLFKGAKGSQGAKGLPGAAGAQGTAVAFAAVSASGATVASQTKNVADANVKHPASGVYCFELPFTVRTSAERTTRCRRSTSGGRATRRRTTARGTTTSV